MNTANPVSSKSSAEPLFWRDKRTWVYVFGLLLAGAVAISNQSFWIDEGFAALKAQQPTLKDWWHAMVQFKGSDLQMPFYMLWLWLYGKIFGTTEIALRAANLFWFVPGVVALLRVLARQPRMQLAVFLTAAFSPFAWFYLNEARPYAMQIGAALFLAAALYRWSQKSPDVSREAGWVAGFVIALIAISGASLLGMIWAFLPITAAIFFLPRIQLAALCRRYWFIWLAGLLFLVTLGFYYLWTLKIGARASTVSGTDWKNLLFVIYELFGFSGLGPGRLAIRSGGTLHVFDSYLPQLALYAAVMFVLAFFACQHVLRIESRKKYFRLLLLAAVPAGFLLTAGFVLQFRILGRHFAPLFPFVVFTLAFGIVTGWQKKFLAKAVVTIFLILSLISCLALRFETRHAKDDYRSAAAVAKTALSTGKRVWWNASDGPALYYHVPLTANPDDSKSAYLIINPTTESVPDINNADMVIISRPDTFDGRGVLFPLLIKKGFKPAQTFPAFVIWKKITESIDKHTSSRAI